MKHFFSDKTFTFLCNIYDQSKNYNLNNVNLIVYRIINLTIFTITEFRNVTLKE